MNTAQLRYKVGGKYSIDSGIFGPTEVRVLLAIIITLEVFIPGTIQYLATAACLFLLISNVVETRGLLRLADERDIAEKAEKAERAERAEKEKGKRNNFAR